MKVSKGIPLSSLTDTMEKLNPELSKMYKETLKRRLIHDTLAQLDKKPVQDYVPLAEGLMLSKPTCTIAIGLEGNIPSKKNSRINCINKRTGKQISFPSKNYQEWHKIALGQVQSQFQGGPISKPCKVQIEYLDCHRRKWDLSNRAESVMDLLVDAGVLEDDNRFIVTELNLKMAELQNGTIGARIYITLLE